MVRTIIVDDETQARNALKNLVQANCPDVKIVGEANSVQEAIKLIDDLKPDLILLDINLGDGTGFNVLERISWNNYQVIFITAYDQYAITAFRFHALDYLLKPVNDEDIKLAIQKQTHQSLNKFFSKQLDLLRASFNEQNIAEKKIVLKDSDSFYFIKVSEIIRCEAQGPYTDFFIQTGQKITISKSLKEYEDILEPFGFVRVHHSHLVNLNKVLRFDKTMGGNLIMDNHHIVPVSQRKKEHLLEILNRI